MMINRRVFALGALATCISTASARARSADPARVSVVGFELLRPSQGAVGMREVSSKAADLANRARKSDKFAEFLIRQALPVVKGPGGGLHVIDHHHLGRALWEAKQRTVHVEIVADLSMHPAIAFWAEMEERGWLHPYDADGRLIGAERLPQHLKDMGDDVYRSLAGAVRDAGGFAKSDVPFAEFKWADFFRVRINRALLARDFNSAVKHAVGLAGSAAAAGLPGNVGRIRRSA